MSNSHSQNARKPIETRVLQSLARHQLIDVPVTHVGNGVIQLDLSIVDRNDRALAIAIARTVAGVTGVAN